MSASSTGSFYASADVNIRFDAQFILTAADNGIKFQYRNFGPGITLSHTIGIENFLGTTGLQYVYNGVPMGNLPVAPLAISFSYNPPAVDVSAEAIVTPPNAALVINGATFTPQASVKNWGGANATFPATFTIFDAAHVEVYTSTQTVTDLAPGATANVDFTPTSIAVNGALYLLDIRVDRWRFQCSETIGRSTTFTVDQHYGTGGPDAALYKWIDNTVVGGPAYSWVDMSASVPITWNGTLDDGWTNGVSLGTPFYFYGNMVSRVWLVTNGMVSFDSLSTYPGYLAAIPSTSTPNNFIGFMRSDMYASKPATVLDDVVNNIFVIQYDSLYFYNTPSQSFDCQIILNKVDSSVTIQYANFNAPGQTDAVIGTEGPGGLAGLQYYYNGAPLLNYPYNGLAIKFFQYTPTLDVSMVSYDAPKGGITGTAYFPAVTVKNNGTTPVTIDATVKIVGPAPATDTVFNFTETTPVVAFGATLPFTFSINSWTPVASGSYSMIALANTAGDEFSTNNSKTGSAFIYNVAALNYTNDFELNDGGFIPTNQWQWGVPTYVSGPTAHSGTQLWGTNLAGDYTALMLNSLYSPAITLTGGLLYKADFWLWYATETNYDGVNVKVSNDFGATWTVITTSVPYNGTGYSTAPGIAGQPVWTGSSTAWVHPTIDLTAYAGQTVILRIDQSSDGSGNAAGAYVDDFSAMAINLDIAVNSIDAPPYIMLAGSYPITATVENLSPVPVTVDSIEFKVEDATPAVVYEGKLYAQALAANAIVPFTSPTPWVVATAGEYSVTVTAYLAADESQGNNAFTEPRIVQVPQAFPYSEDYENPANLGNWWIFYNGSGAGVGWTTAIAHSPTHSIDISYSPYPRELWFVGPPVTITAAIIPQLKYWEAGDSYWGDEPNQQIGVSLMVDGFDLNGTIQLGLWTPATHTLEDGIFTSNQFDLTPYIGHTVWPVFYFNSPTFYSGDWFLDDVSMYESAVPAISIAPATLDHSQNSGTTQTYIADFTISNPGTAPLTWNASNTLPWITMIPAGVVPAGGSLPIDVTVNTAGLLGGMYNDVITITSNDPANPTVTLPINIYVMAAQIYVSPGSVHITQETDVNMTHSNVIWVGNNGGPDLHFTASNTLSWITVDPTVGTVPMEGTQPISLIINTAGLAIGDYSDLITINSNDPASPVNTVPVTITVSQMTPGVDHLDFSLLEGLTQTLPLPINNASAVDIRVDLVAAPSEWLSVDPIFGIIPAAGSMDFNVTVNAAALAEGFYNGTITITSSNVTDAIVIVPINVTIERGGCDYITGDANNSQVFNGLDVTYSVTYFKGGPPPPFSCECTVGHIWYVAGDVNGSCSFNGLDVTTMVGYFKGFFTVSPCPDCPPARGILKVKDSKLNSEQ